VRLEPHEPPEQGARLGVVPRALVQVGERVRPPQVVLPRLLGQAEPLREQAHRGRQLAAVGERSGHDDATLGHERRARRGLAQLGPQALDLAVLAHRAPAVGEDRVLFGAAAAELDERIQVAGRVLPPPEAVERQPVQLADLGEVRHLAHDGSEDLAGLAEPLPGERRRGLADALLEALGAARAHEVDEPGCVHLDAGRRTARRLPWTGRGARAGRALVDPDLLVAGAGGSRLLWGLAARWAAPARRR